MSEYIQAQHSLPIFTLPPSPQKQTNNEASKRLIYAKYAATAAAATTRLQPAILSARGAALGMLFVATPPRYQEPTSVSWPFWSSMAALGPTLDTSERKAPKYE